jgi:biotin transporter BioY
MTPIQEKLTRVIVSSVMAVIVIFICGFVVLSITQEVDVMNDPLDNMPSCKGCHTNMNATENITDCESCRIMWSNVYT